MRMRVFISWSGERSKAIAAFLHRWLPDVIQTVQPWMSANDIDAGARWNRTIDKQLGETKFGIICATPENLTAPWVLFEAGALAKTIEDTFVCPYLIGMTPAQLPQGPLTQFQAKQANEKESLELVSTINKALKEPQPEDRIKRAFDRCWPELRDVLAKLPEAPTKAPKKRDADEMIEEILGVVRGLSHTITELAPSRIENILDTRQRQWLARQQLENTAVPLNSPRFKELLDAADKFVSKSNIWPDPDPPHTDPDE